MKEKLDKKWFSRLNKIGEINLLKSFGGERSSRNKQRELFLSGKIKNPELDYPNLNSKKSKLQERELLELKKQIAEEKNIAIRKAYEWKVDELIGKVRLIQASSQKNWQLFNVLTDYLYKPPSVEIFNYFLLLLLERVNRSVEVPQNKEKAQKLLKLLSSENIQPQKLQSPSEKIIIAVQEKVRKEMSSLLNCIPKLHKNNNAQEITRTFNVALGMIKAIDWRAEVDTQSGRKLISVDHKKKRIIVPATRQMTTEILQGRVIHEIGTHILRRINGESSPLRLLSLGLDRSEIGEEGIAVLREQVLKESPTRFSSWLTYLAVGLVRGLDGKTRDFRDLFEIIEKIVEFDLIESEKKELLEKESFITNRVWSLYEGVFRGTDCKTLGVCFTRDMIYAKGNISIWEFLKKNPAEINRFNLGKYDPSNERHRWILQQLNL